MSFFMKYHLYFILFIIICLTYYSTKLQKQLFTKSPHETNFKSFRKMKLKMKLKVKLNPVKMKMKMT